MDILADGTIVGDMLNKWRRISILKERTRLSCLLGKYVLGINSWYLGYEITALSDIREMNINV
jgi:hypothetical protein